MESSRNYLDLLEPGVRNMKKKKKIEAPSSGNSLEGKARQISQKMMGSQSTDPKVDSGFLRDMGYSKKKKKKGS